MRPIIVEDGRLLIVLIEANGLGVLIILGKL